MKRGYLLPEGCKDIIDVPQAKQQPVVKNLPPPAPFPPITGELTVAARMTVTELAAVLKQKPFKIVADLMEVGLFVNAKHTLDFNAIVWVARKHGLTAKRAE